MSGVNNATFWGVKGTLDLRGDMTGTLTLRNCPGKIILRASKYGKVVIDNCDNVEIITCEFNGNTDIAVDAYCSNIFFSLNNVFSGTYSSYAISVRQCVVKVNNLLTLNGLTINNNNSIFGSSLANVDNIGGSFVQDIVMQAGLNVNQTAWVTPTLTANFTSGTLASAGAVKYRLKNGNVEIKGSFTPSDLSTADQTIFTLPVGFRPISRYDYTLRGSGGRSLTVMVTTAGTVLMNKDVNTNLNNSWYNFSIMVPVN
jgi:hypothetical protein